MERLVGIEPTYVQTRILLPNPIGHRRIVCRLSHTWAVHDEYRLETVVLNTLIPLPSYLFSPRARLLLGLHVLGSLFNFSRVNCGHTQHLQFTL